MMANILETLKSRLPRLVSGGEILRIQETMRALSEAYYEGPFQLPPEQLLNTLREYDSAVLGDLVNQLYWEQLGGGYSMDMTRARERATDESRRQWVYSVLYQWAVWLWTNYGFGENIIVTAKDAKPEGEIREIAHLCDAIRTRLPELVSRDALSHMLGMVQAFGEAYDRVELTDVIQEEDTTALKYGEDYFREFWGATRNQPVLAADKLHNLSNRVLVDGNQFLSYSASTMDGAATVRKIKPSEIVEIITDPDENSLPWFYKRQWSVKSESRTWYYPSWEAFFSEDLEKKAEVLPKGAVRADTMRVNEERLGTAVCIQHIAHNCKEEDSLWGWPLSVAGAPWLREHKKFREHRASVAASRAMYTWKVGVKGGSRGVGSVQSQLASAFATGGTRETNPPPVAGSTWVENPAAVLEALSQNTGAGDAKEDGNALAWMGLLGLGVYPHYGGIGDVLRWATAQMLEGPILRQWSRYQLFWSAQFRTMVRIVLKFREKYGGAKFETYEAEVSTDRLVETDLAAITGAVSEFYREVLVPLITGGIVSRELAGAITARVLRIMLQALGVSDAEDVASDEAFERKEREAEEREFTSPEERALVEAAERIVQRG